jgi:hypothetical protein
MYSVDGGDLGGVSTLPAGHPSSPTELCWLRSCARQVAAVVAEQIVEDVLHLSLLLCWVLTKIIVVCCFPMLQIAFLLYTLFQPDTWLNTEIQGCVGSDVLGLKVRWALLLLMVAHGLSAYAAEAVASVVVLTLRS